MSSGVPFDVERFYAALDQVRASRGSQWRQVADEAGISASTLTRMAQGKRPDVDGLAALIRWSTLDANEFFGTRKSHVDAIDKISGLIRADASLTTEQSDAMVRIVRSVYDLVKPKKSRTK